MYRPILALFTVLGSSFFSRVVFCYDESPWQQSYDYYQIDLGELGGHHGGPVSKVPVPRDVLVDVINDLGIKLLAIHNERNDNNIAISPYGALSVLAALTEGVQGDAAHEILHAARIPKDKQVIRVGLRDIHRHLKSYFIPEEGFLAGLTLNLNNVTLRSEYEDILKFYGFDYGSFNNALYPEPLTTQKPPEGTTPTLGTTLGKSEGSTTESTLKTEPTTIVLPDSRFGVTTAEKGTTEGTTSKELTTTLLTTIQGKEETATTKEMETTSTTALPSSTTLPLTTQTLTTSQITPQTITTTTIPETTTTIPEFTTTVTPETTPKELLQTSAITDKTTETVTETLVSTTQPESTKETVVTAKEEPNTTISAKSPTESVSITTKISKVTTKIPEMSTKSSEITTKLPKIPTVMSTTTTQQSTITEILATAKQETTTQTITTITSEIPEATSTVTTDTQTPSTITTPSTMAPPTTTNEVDTTTVTSEIPALSVATTVMPQNNGEILRTTRQISANVMSGSQLTTVPVGESIIPPEITTIPTTLPNELTTLPQELTTMASVEDTTVPFVSPIVPFQESNVENEFVNPLVNTPPQFFDQPEVDVETTTPFFFGTTPDFQDTTTLNQNNLDYNYNYEANAPFDNNSAVEGPPAYDDNDMANLVNNNLMPNTAEGASFNRNVRRRARSVVDYVIARYYDNNHSYRPPPQTPSYLPQQEPQRPHYLPQPEPLQRPQYLPQQEPPQRPHYVPQQEPLTFAVYGKYRESGINFMKYDTVLPFYFASNLNALALSFPLDSTKYYLLLLLPLEDNGVDQLICDLRLHGNLKYIIEHLRLTHVVATIPSFMLKGYVTLTPLLQRLGIRRIFEPRQADFSPMTNVTDIYVTNIEQAVTVTIRNYLDPSAQHYKNFRQYAPVHFKADHPFLYFVIDSDLHVALMVGKVINPLNSRIR